MFSSEEITRKISGVVLSPIALRNDAKKLYITRKMTPRRNILK